MSKGSALVSILFAFFAGVVIGNVTSGPKAATETAAAEAKDEEAGAAAEANVAAVKEDGGPDRLQVPVTAAQPVKGAKDALVTVVEFSDFQCPFCSRVEPTIEQLLKDYAGKLRVVWRNNPLPFHQEAMPAAIFAMEAMAQGGSEKFWAAHKKLFENQKALTRPDLDRYTTELGLDAAKVKAALDGKTHETAIKADQELAAKTGARGTPAFFINGRFLSGAQPIDAFKQIIDDEIKRTEKMVASGTPKAQLYAALMKGAQTAAKPPEPAQPRRMPDPAAIYKVPVGKSATKGPADALVTIVEFSEFQCPFCSRVLPTVKQIQETYGKDVRVVFKHNPLPFHNNAQKASEAAVEAREQGKFWEMHDLLFANQQALTVEDLEKHAKAVGLNAAKFKAALESGKHKTETDADQALARSLGASGTPSFFINGRSLRGAQPFEAFKAVIDEELKKAKDLVAAGTPKAQVYAKITENGATEPKFIEAPGAAPGQPSAAPQDPNANKVFDIAMAAKAPTKGSPRAKVVIQEFSDFQCPFCGRVLPTIKQIEQEYGDKVQVIWRNYPLPFHDKAFKAAEASREVFEQAGSEKFWAYHDKLFENQRALEPENLIKYAEEVGGINAGRLKAALDSDKHKAAVQADMDAVSKAGAQIGTPSFFINGKLLQGAQPFPAFKAAIDAALAAAK